MLTRRCAQFARSALPTHAALPRASVCVACFATRSRRCGGAALAAVATGAAGGSGASRPWLRSASGIARDGAVAAAVDDATASRAAVPHGAPVTSEPVKIRAVATYGLQRVKLGELEKVVRWQSKASPTKWHITSDRDWTIFSLKPVASAAVDDMSSDPASRKASHVAVSKRGPIVCINCALSSAAPIIGAAHLSVSSQPLKDGEILEYVNITVDPNLPSWSAYRNGEICVKRLDVDGVRVLSAVLAQTVVLQHYEELADKMHEIVGSLNAFIERGDIDKLHTEQLHRLLGETNQISGDVILSGLHNISQPGYVGWSEGRYEQFQKQLEEEYELQTRYEELESKLAFVSGLIRYCLNLKRDRMIERLEWMIVVILTLEAGISGVSWLWLPHLHGAA